VQLGVALAAQILVPPELAQAQRGVVVFRYPGPPSQGPAAAHTHVLGRVHHALGHEPLVDVEHVAVLEKCGSNCLRQAAGLSGSSESLLLTCWPRATRGCTRASETTHTRYSKKVRLTRKRGKGWDDKARCQTNRHVGAQ
jgi:hypothetical protein